MNRQQCNTLQNFDDSKTDILKKRLLKTTNLAAAANLQQNVLLTTFRAPTSSSMIVSSVQSPQSSMPITHGLVTHSLAPVKIHTNNPAYPLQLSTVHVPVQIPGSSSNINVPVHLSGSRNIPLQLTGPTVSLPIQVSSTTTVPVQLTSGDTISVPLQLPAGGQNIQLSSHPGMPLLQNTSQSLHGSIFQVHMGTNQRPSTMEGVPEMGVPASTHLQITDPNGMQVKMNNPTPNTVVQIPNSSSNSIQLTLPSSANAGPVQLRGARPVPHVVYIQTPQGLKPVTSSDMITQASSSGNPPQIIVRRPVSNSGNIQIISNMSHKTNLAPKMSVQNKSSLLTHGSVSQPIVIQKPKDKMMVPVSIATGGANKQAIAYLAPVKKNKTKSAEQSILIPNNQNNVTSTSANQKLFLTPMNMPKIQNTKFILPVTLPASMASKGPVINFQIANGQIQNDPQGNITVMRDTGSMETTEMPPLQPLAKNANGRENPGSVSQSPKSDKSFTIPGSIPGSRAEPTGEQEYSLSIPDNASMNDDIYTVSIADEDGAQRVNSFTLSSMQEKGKSLISKNPMDRNDASPSVHGAAILRRSNSDNSERKTANENLKRRISLCSENLSNKSFKHDIPHKSATDKREEDPDNSDDHRVPSLFCDEKLDLDVKPAAGDSEPEDYKVSRNEPTSDGSAPQYLHYSKTGENYLKREKLKRESVDAALEDDPPGLMWNNGVAILQGSGLQFQTNEFGLIDLIDHCGEESFMVHSTKYQTPLKQRIDRSGREKKPTSPEDLYRCDGCGCHGMAAEFITPNFCSLTCQNDKQKIIHKKRDRDRIEAKKRNKLRKLAGGLSTRKQLSDTEMLEHSDKVSLKQYDSMPSDARLTESMDEFVENEKYPWMCGKNGFSWMRYLEFCKAKAAPVKLFNDPFPYNRNGFKVNMRLEAIDPQHPSFFCVVSVAEVQGYRMRLHFDEYPDMYDFWVNADSSDIYPAGWSERNGRQLKPPGSMQGSAFSWPIYLKQVRAVAAPRHCFVQLGHMLLKPIGFRIGMKLEAEDRKNNLVCVATVADIMDHRMLINFDSWDEMYDYWVDVTSPYIHAVGWAEENCIALTPPNFYKDPDSFSWESYLNETNSTAAPARAFKTRPPAGFKAGMKLEVVDQRVPFLIRVATISEVKGHQLRVSFDGWPEELSHWLDDDSPDIHPVGWCLKTGHPLEPPLTAEELSVSGPCGYFGCRGLGSLRGGAHKKHGAATACPYVPRAPASPPDRLAAAGVGAERAAVPVPRRVLGRPPKLHASTPTSDTPTERTERQRGRPPKHKRLEAVAKAGSDEESVSSGGARTPAAPAPPPPPRVSARALREHVPPDVRAHAQGLPARAQDWTQSDVFTFVSRACGAAAASAARAARLGGRELLMCSREELVASARLRLGPAIKLHAAVRALRAATAATAHL